MKVKKLKFSDYIKLHKERIYWNNKELITETRGVNPHILKLAQHILAKIQNKNFVSAEQIESGVMFLIKIDIDSFVEYIYIKYISNSSNNAEGSCDVDSDIPIITIENAKNNNDILNVLCHELGHLYHYKQLLSTNQGYIPETEKILNKRYADNGYILDNEKIGKLEKNIRLFLYSITKGEIHSFLEELYQYIVLNKNINRNNYKSFLQNTNAFIIFTNLHKMVNKIDTYNKDEKNKIGEIYKNYIKSNDTPQRAFQRFRGKVIQMVKWFTDRYYNTIYYALEKAEKLDESRIVNNEKKILKNLCQIKNVKLIDFF